MQKYRIYSGSVLQRIFLFRKKTSSTRKQRQVNRMIFYEKASLNRTAGKKGFRYSELESGLG